MTLSQNDAVNPYFVHTEELFDPELKTDGFWPWQWLSESSKTTILAEKEQQINEQATILAERQTIIDAQQRQIVGLESQVTTYKEFVATLRKQIQTRDKREFPHLHSDVPYIDPVKHGINHHLPSLLDNIKKAKERVAQPHHPESSEHKTKREAIEQRAADLHGGDRHLQHTSRPSQHRKGSQERGEINSFGYWG
jgi:hypothetical protein